MSPTGIRRTVALLLILSPWIFIPGIIKDIFFIVVGVLLFISTFDLRRKQTNNPTHQETDSTPLPHVEQSA
jgi:hypothetical protein